ncbi:MAG: UDP-N-acetyl-2-amino-2-deoxyglucuronate dehydrogenase [Flavobacteriales bacterium]|jgi:UDP-N-acetyl-2-amino-2-deoxyglucuronate dehydrogenase
MSKKVKFAIVGCGHIGKRHAEMITGNQEAELLALCDVQDKNDLGLEDYDVPYFNDLKLLLDEIKDIDVLSICTPNGLHSDQALIALGAGANVLCEKPMGLSKANCESVIFKALEVSKQVFCVMQNRYSPPSIWLKEMITEKRLGDIYMVQIDCFWNRDERYYKKDSWKGTKDLDGGTLFTQFAHFIDLMYWVFGDIKNIAGKFNNFSHKELTSFEDSGIVNFDFMKGGMGSINYSTSVWNKNFESSLTVVGEKGTIKVGGQYMNEVSYCHVEDYKMPELSASKPANDYGHYKGSAANHSYVIENVVDTLNHRTTATTNALEGLKVVEIIERIYEVRNRQK